MAEAASKAIEITSYVFTCPGYRGRNSGRGEKVRRMNLPRLVREWASDYHGDFCVDWGIKRYQLAGPPSIS